MAVDYSQNDLRWKAKKLGFSSWETIGMYGCLITSAANVITAQGVSMDPNQVNDFLKSHGGYVRDSYGQIADVAGYPVLGLISPKTRFVEQKN